MIGLIVPFLDSSANMAVISFQGTLAMESVFAKWSWGESWLSNLSLSMVTAVRIRFFMVVADSFLVRHYPQNLRLFTLFRLTSQTLPSALKANSPFSLIYSVALFNGYLLVSMKKTMLPLWYSTPSLEWEIGLSKDLPDAVVVSSLISDSDDPSTEVLDSSSKASSAVELELSVLGFEGILDSVLRLFFDPFDLIRFFFLNNNRLGKT